MEQNPKNYFESLKKLYGAFYIIKVFPNRVWGDTIAINKRTNKNIVIPDISQVVQLRFSKLVPIDSIINFLNKQPFIKYAQGPSVIKLSVSPNDPLYSTAPRWAFDRINAERSWEISKGFTTISINDYFTGTPLHEDLVGKVVYIQGQMQDHGGAVAGIAGAMTNNSLGVASLGWNINLMLHTWGGTAIYDAINRGADVINFSWIRQQWDEPYLREALHTALLQGIVCVAGAGNQLGNVNYIPSVQYPAAYNFGTDGQVIAVSATQWDGTYETFVDEWNYSPGTDPINDPTNSFIDISAPGKGIEIILGSNSYSPNGAGTSDASAFVSALCGLILSVNNSLTPNQVYNIITKSAEKVGQYSYDTNGWNRYMGYGRINAYNALKYTLENYGGTLTQNLTIPVGETWNFVPGVTVKFASGITLIINGILNAVGTSSNKIIFDRSSTTGTWGSITFDGSPASSSILDNVDIKYASDIKCLNGANVTIQNSLIDHCTQGIYVYNSQPQILNNQIIEPVQNGIYCNALGKSPLILNNVITKTSSNPTFRNYQGIWLENHTNGYIAHNDVQGFYWGIYAGGGSSGNFTNYGFQNFNPNNRICNNSFGFAAGWGSSISAGYLMYYGMNNSIYNNVS